MINATIALIYVLVNIIGTAKVVFTAGNWAEEARQATTSYLTVNRVKGVVALVSIPVLVVLNVFAIFSR